MEKTKKVLADYARKNEELLIRMTEQRVNEQKKQKVSRFQLPHNFILFRRHFFNENRFSNNYPISESVHVKALFINKMVFNELHLLFSKSD